MSARSFFQLLQKSAYFFDWQSWIIMKLQSGTKHTAETAIQTVREYKEQTYSKMEVLFNGFKKRFIRN